MTIPGSAALPALLVALAFGARGAGQERGIGSPYETERARALRVLIEGGEASRPALLGMAASREARTRAAGIEGLGMVGTAADVDAIAGMFAGELDPMVRRSAVQAVVALCARGSGPKDGVAALPETLRSETLRALPKILERLVVKAIDDAGDAGVAFSAFRRFRGIRELGAVCADPLVRLAGAESPAPLDVRPEVRSFAFIALARAAGPGPFVDPGTGGMSKLVKEGVADREEPVQNAALYGGAFAGVATLPYLREVMAVAAVEAQSPRVVDAAAYHLSNLPPAALEALRPEIVTLARRLVASDDEIVRNAAAWMVITHRLHEAFDATAEAFRKEKGYAAYRLLVALRLTSHDHPDGGLSASFERILGEAATHAQPAVRGYRHACLVDDKREPPGFEGRERLLLEIEESLVTEKDSAVDPDGYSRQACLEVLSFLGDKRARPAIERCLKDPNETVEMIAARALGGLGEGASRAPLEAALAERDEYAGLEAAIALVALGRREAAQALVGFLDTGNAVIERRALAALSDALGAPVALGPGLRGAARKEAIEAIRKKLGG